MFVLPNSKVHYFLPVANNRVRVRVNIPELQKTHASGYFHIQLGYFPTKLDEKYKNRQMFDLLYKDWSIV